LDEDAVKAMAQTTKFVLRGRILQLDSAMIKPRKDRRTSTEEEDLSTTPDHQEPTPKQQEEVEADIEEKKVTKTTSKAKVTTTNTKVDSTNEVAAITEQKAVTTAGSVSRSLKYIAFGLPDTVNKKDFKKVSSKACRKAEIAPMNQTDPLYETVQVLEPTGKMFLMSIPSRKNIEKLVEFFETATTGSFIDTLSSSSSSTTTTSTVTTRKNGKKIHLRSLADITELHLRKKKCRLILRNLSFQATEQNILDRLSQFGPIVEVMIPRVEVQKSSKRKRRQSSDNNTNDEEGEEELHVEDTSATKLQPRGFGFVTFLCARDALAAVGAGTGIKICNREIAVDFCASKAVHDKILKGGFATNPSSVVADADTPFGIDAAPTQSLEEEDNDDDEEDDVDEQEEEEDEDEDNEDEDDNNDEDEDDNDDDEEKPIEDKVKESDAAEMKTVFLRELAFDSTEKDIRDALRTFGKISLAILVKGKYMLLLLMLCYVNTIIILHHILMVRSISINYYD